MTQFQTNSNSWQPCPTGELSRLASRLRSQRRRRAVLRVATVCSLGIAMMSVAMLGIVSHCGLSYGGIRCGEVASALPDFVAGQLDEVHSRQIREHLTQCPVCRWRHHGVLAKPVSQQHAEPAHELAASPNRVVQLAIGPRLLVSTPTAK